jgi:hypothetical protein
MPAYSGLNYRGILKPLKSFTLCHLKGHLLELYTMYNSPY